MFGNIGTAINTMAYRQPTTGVGPRPGVPQSSGVAGMVQQPLRPQNGPFQGPAQGSQMQGPAQGAPTQGPAQGTPGYQNPWGGQQQQPLHPAVSMFLQHLSSNPDLMGQLLSQLRGQSAQSPMMNTQPFLGRFGQ